MKIEYRGFRIVANYNGHKACPSDVDNMNSYRITVTNLAREHKPKVAFDFWQSHAKPRMDTASDVLGAFHCFVSDAVAAENNDSYSDFCREFGYDPFDDSRDKPKNLGWIIYTSCKRSLAQYKELTGEDVYEMLTQTDDDIHEFHLKGGDVAWAKTLVK